MKKVVFVLALCAGSIFASDGGAAGASGGGDSRPGTPRPGRALTEEERIVEALMLAEDPNLPGGELRVELIEGLMAVAEEAPGGKEDRLLFLQMLTGQGGAGAPEGARSVVLEGPDGEQVVMPPLAAALMRAEMNEGPDTDGAGAASAIPKEKRGDNDAEK